MPGAFGVPRPFRQRAWPRMREYNRLLQVASPIPNDVLYGQPGPNGQQVERWLDGISFDPLQVSDLSCVAEDCGDVDDFAWDATDNSEPTTFIPAELRTARTCSTIGLDSQELLTRMKAEFAANDSAQLTRMLIGMDIECWQNQTIAGTENEGDSLAVNVVPNDAIVAIDEAVSRLEDALASVRWAVAQLGVDRVAVGGDSAGAALATVCAQELPDRVAAQLLVYPTTDPYGHYPSRVENATGYFLDQPTMEWFFTHYVGSVADLRDDDPRVSPMRGTLAGLAPALVVTAEFDPLRDEGEAYAARLAEAGVAVDVVRYDGMIHGFLDMGPFSPAAATAVDDLVERTKKLLHG